MTAIPSFSIELCRFIRLAFVLVPLIVSCASEKNAAEAPAQVANPKPAPTHIDALAPFSQRVPGTTVSLEMKPVPADASAGTHALWIASTETTWDMYDAFVFAMDRAETEKDPPDAWTRPSKPYILMDRGYGHTGYPVISVSVRGASEFCKWLSAKTGKRFRLPTETEWEVACRAGSKSAYSFGDDKAQLDAYAWYEKNSEVDSGPATHPVAQKKPSALGLFDAHGNAAEWAIGADGKGVARGGSFRDSAENVTASARRLDDKSLNRTDPQLPKSLWWLADGGFIGFRVACEPDPAAH